MQKIIVKCGFTRSFITRICVSLLLVMGFVGGVTACGGGGGSSVSAYSSNSYLASWSPVTDSDLDVKIVDENTLIEELNKKKVALETEVKDTTLDTTVVQEKTASLKAVQEQIKEESEKLSILREAKTVESQMYQVSAPKSGGGISGLKVKFSESSKTAPSAGYFSYMISPYSAVNFDQQKAAVFRAFDATQIQYSEKDLMDSCIEHLGLYMCSQGTNGAF